MPELRWTLLLLGALFIAVLAWAERRKARQSTRSAHEPTISDAPPTPPRVHREPVAHDLSLPEIRARDLSLPHDLPVVQVEDESLGGLSIEGDFPPAPQEGVADLPVLEAAEEAEVDVERTVAMSASAPSPASPSAPSERAALEPVSDSELAPENGSEERLDASSINARPMDALRSDARHMDAPPIVDWPPEEDRRIIALRLVSVSPDRFSGRAIRTALVAEGFVHGKFSIFHKPDAHNRAVLSVASLSKPGVFDLETIDSQRFSGLNLFAVVSGTHPAREMFEQLLSCARNLNERLEGGLQDDRGGPLTPSRIAALRESLGAAGASPAPFG